MLAYLITSSDQAQSSGRLKARLNVRTHPAVLVLVDIGYLPIRRTGLRADDARLSARLYGLRLRLGSKTRACKKTRCGTVSSPSILTEERFSARVRELASRSTVCRPGLRRHKEIIVVSGQTGSHTTENASGTKSLL